MAPWRDWEKKHLPKSQEPQLPGLTLQSSNGELANTQPKFKLIFTLFEGCTILLLQVSLFLSLNTYLHLAVMITDYVIRITFHCFFGTTYAQSHFVTILIKHWSNVRIVSHTLLRLITKQHLYLIYKKIKTGMSKVLTWINYIFSTQVQLCNGKCMSIQYKKQGPYMSVVFHWALVKCSTQAQCVLAVIRAA
jgi:hypothetical protein